MYFALSYNRGTLKKRMSKMSYNELAKNRNIEYKGTAVVARQVLIHILYFVSGVLVARGAVLGSLSPFGASYAAAVPFTYMPSALLGCSFGYLLLNPVDSFRYIAIVISIGALRWVLNEFKKVSESRFFPSAVAFIPVLMTGVALTFSSSSEITEITMCLMEAALSAAGAYFIGRSTTVCLSNKSLFSLTSQEIACLAMTGCILLLSFGSLTISSISVGRIFACLFILLAARYSGVYGGCITAVATGIIFSLSSMDMAFLCAGYAFSGLMGGLFASVNKLCVAVCMLVCNLTVSFASSDNEIIFAIFVETLTACVVFMLLPKSVGNYIRNIFVTKPDTKSEQAARRAVTMRLSFASKALDNVSSCVNSVSDKLSRLYTPNAQWIYDNVRDNTCVNCGMRYYCWEKCKEQTNNDFHKLTESLCENEFVKEQDIVDNFTKKCCRISELVYSINQTYKEYKSCEAARKRISQIRFAVAGQFAGMSDILEDLAEEFEDYDQYDLESSDRIVDALSALSLVVVDCSCRISKGKGMVVEVELVLSPKTNVSKSQVMHEISRCCGRTFDSPAISYEQDRVRLVLTQRAKFDVDIGSSAHIFNDGELCGDCINYFNNGMGSTVVMLSDGMGTGGRAAVDSNMAVSIMSKLLKAGLSYDCALQVVNSSLMIKSEDESMATLDVLDFNLFSGKAELYKAGACTTYIRKNGKMYRKCMQGLPIGILNEVRFYKESISLNENDMILMVSDGVLCLDDDEIEQHLNKTDSKSAQEIASEIVNHAKNRRNGDHDDDITAIVIRVLEN